MNTNKYAPDSVTPPGFYVQEKLEDLGWSWADLAQRTGHPITTIGKIITGTAPIDCDMAADLKRVLGFPIAWTLEAERIYRASRT